MTNLNLILQTNNIEIQTKKSVLDFSIIIADVIFSVLMMATQESVLMASQDEVDRVCQEREVALGRVLQGWEQEIMGTRDHQGAPVQRTAQVSNSRGAPPLI